MLTNEQEKLKDDINNKIAKIQEDIKLYQNQNHYNYFFNFFSFLDRSEARKHKLNVLNAALDFLKGGKYIDFKNTVNINNKYGDALLPSETKNLIEKVMIIGKNMPVRNRLDNKYINDEGFITLAKNR